MAALHTHVGPMPDPQGYSLRYGHPDRDTMHGAHRRPTIQRLEDEDHEAGPWKHMAQTYAWVAEQEHLSKRDRKTEQWILEQQLYRNTSYGGRRSPWRTGAERKLWEEVVYSYELEAERWMRQEEHARWLAAEKEKMKARMVEEEMRRIEAKIRYRREEQRRRFMEERSRMEAEYREWEMRERARSEKMILDAWNAYESRWDDLKASSKQLRFANIPWPLVSRPVDTESISQASIAGFLLSPVHSQGQSRKERVRNAQLKWHPDRFRRFMERVAEEDKAKVEEGVGIVARCLNEMMATENKPNRFPLKADKGTIARL